MRQDFAIVPWTPCFCGRRLIGGYGAAQVYVACLMLFNMGVAMTAEFTAVGDMFAIVIGSIRWPIVVIIGIVSAAYTAYGGLYVSIVTDQVLTV